MKLKFWGVRGSIPAVVSNEVYYNKLKNIILLLNDKKFENKADIENFINLLPFNLKCNYGGNTSCIEIDDDEGNIFIVDAGTGLKNMGNEYLKREKKINTIHIFFTHFHWDHIQGIPFFVPAYNPNVKIIFYSTKKGFKKLLEFQQNKYNFPVTLDMMGSKKEYVLLQEGKKIKIGETVIENLKMHHPGGCTAYSFKHGEKKIVITGDVEFQEEDLGNMNKFGDFFKRADVGIFDSQYTLEESFSKFDWGHTTYTMAINLAANWEIKNLFLSHHDPNYDDNKLLEIENLAKDHLKNMRDTKMSVLAAYEGLEIKI